MNTTASDASSAQTAGTAPLTPMQAGIWLMNQAFPGRPVFNSSVTLRLTGPLDVPALSRSVTAIADRHAPLRSVYRFESGALAQRVLHAAPIPFDVIEVRQDGMSGPAGAAAAAAQSFIAAPIDLRTDRPLAARLVRLSADDHVLAVRVHHIAFDGWSARVFRDELLEHYGAALEGREPVLRPLANSFPEYAASQAGRLASGALEQSFSYWTARLAGLPDACSFPHDHAAPETPAFRAVRRRLVLSAATLAGVTALGKAERGTPFMVLLAAFQGLLARLSGQEDVVVGVPVAGRDSEAVEPMIGCFINNVVLRATVSPHATLRELVGQARSTTLEALTHREAPYPELVKRLRPGRNIGTGRLFNVLFQFMNLPGGDITRAGGLTADRFDLDSAPAESDVTFVCSVRDGALECSCSADLDLFEPASAGLLLDQYAALLGQALASPDAPISSHTLRTPSTSHLLPDPAAPIVEPVFEPPVTAVLRQADRSPDRTAVTWAGRDWTYGQLAEDTRRTAVTLAGLGLARGEAIGVLGRKSYGLVVGALAVMRAGGVVVLLDPDLPPLRIGAMLTAAKSARTFWVRGNAAWPAGITAPALTLDEHGRHAGHVPAGARASLPDISSNGPAYVFFTSGTTGEPKAILGTHKGFAHFMAWESGELHIGPEDRVSMLTSLTFDPILRDIFIPLLSGAQLCIPPHAISGPDVIRWLNAERVSVVHTVPSLSDTWITPGTPRGGARTVRAVVFTGEPLSDALVAKWRRSLRPGTTLVNVYGPTETTLEKSFFVVPDPPRPGTQPIGRALPDTQLLLVNPAGTLCGVNEPGEILIRTPFGTLGYLNNAAEQAARFVPNPFRSYPSDTVYRTGDLGRYRPDGQAVILGRTDDQLKVRGVRIEPAEVNSVLRAWPAVSSSAVVGRKVAGAGELIAYVVPAGELTDNAVRAYLAARLPHAMVPARVMFLTTLPVGPNGKLDRKALPEPGVVADSASAPFAAPEGDVERRLARIWCDVMRLDRVSRDASFFDLGGHSLLAGQVFDRIHTVFGVRLPLNSLFSAPTVAQLAALMGQTDARWPALLPVRTSGDRPPLFLVHGAGGNSVQFEVLARHMPPSQPIFAFEPPGLDGRRTKEQSVEELASSYLAGLLRVQEEGPVYLAGTSMGGVVAYEMARQLAASGRAVAFVGLMDTRPPQGRKRRRWTDLRSAWNNSAGTFEELRCRLTWLSGGSVSPGAARRLVLRRNIRAVRKYRPGPLEGTRVVLFRAGTPRKRHVSHAQVETWRRVTGGEVEVIDIAGSHFGRDYYLTEPNVAGFAQTLAAALSRSSGRD